MLQELTKYQMIQLERWYERLARTNPFSFIPYVTSIFTPHRNLLPPSARCLDASVP